MGRWRGGSADKTVHISNLIVPGTTTPIATNMSNSHHHHNHIDWLKHTHSVDVTTNINARTSTTERLCTSTLVPEGFNTNSAPYPSITSNSKFKYPFDENIELLTQESTQEDENLFWDINLTDPLMTDAIYETEDLIFTHSSLLKQLGVNQCSLCSTPYLMQHTGFLSDTSPTTDSDIVWPANSQSTSPTHSSSSAISDPSSPSPEWYRKQKPKFFRSSRFSHHLGYEQDSKKYPLVRGVGFTKRWTPRSGSTFLRNGKRARTKPNSYHSRTISTSSNDSMQLPIFPDRTHAPGGHMLCNNHCLFTMNGGCTSDIASASTIDPSPYAFDASPTLHHTNLHQYDAQSGVRLRAAVGHGPKRLHLLQFILKLLREPPETKGYREKLWPSPTPETNQGEISPRPNSSACVEWVDEGERIFTIKNPFRLAQLWGMYKNNWNMTFESLCRSLRLYYVSGKLERIRGQRNQYRLLGPHR